MLDLDADGQSLLPCLARVVGVTPGQFELAEVDKSLGLMRPIPDLSADLQRMPVG